MNKAQAINEFWNSFGVPAYDENTLNVDSSVKTYITYSVQEGKLDDPIVLNASIWTRNTSWTKLDEIKTNIAHKLYTMNPIKLDDGYLHLTSGTPFAQRFRADEDPDYLRILIVIQAEFFTAY